MAVCSGGQEEAYIQPQALPLVTHSSEGAASGRWGSRRRCIRQVLGTRSQMESLHLCDKQFPLLLMVMLESIVLFGSLHISPPFLLVLHTFQLAPEGKHSHGVEGGEQWEDCKAHFCGKFEVDRSDFQRVGMMILLLGENKDFLVARNPDLVLLLICDHLCFLEARRELTGASNFLAALVQSSSLHCVGLCCLGVLQPLEDYITFWAPHILFSFWGDHWIHETFQ